MTLFFRGKRHRLAARTGRQRRHFFGFWILFLGYIKLGKIASGTPQPAS
jgi:hypothetical protein